LPRRSKTRSFPDETCRLPDEEKQAWGGHALPRLLKRPKHPTVEQIAEVTGCQHRTTRGALSGAPPERRPEAPPPRRLHAAAASRPAAISSKRRLSLSRFGAPLLDLSQH
jgi:hypothetical protein